MISVAMTTYNGKKYVIKQLKSIANQDEKIDELVIVDDCSTDDTYEIVKNYLMAQDINYKLIKNEKNLGYILSFRKAIETTIGDVIVLCDHDDIWESNKISIIKKTFEDNEGIVALATSFIKINENDEIIEEKLMKGHANNNLIRHKIKKNSLNKLNYKDVMVYNISPGCTCAFRGTIKETFLKHNYNIPHDLEILNIGAHEEGLYYLDKITTRYRIYQKNTIGLGHEDDYEKRVKVVKKNMLEKEELLDLTEVLYGNRSKEYLYMLKLIDIFDGRVELLENKKMWIFPILFFKAFGFNKLYESILMDFISIVKSIHRRK